MDFKTFLFFALAAILVFAALRVVTAKNPVHAVLNLILAFFTTAGIWLLLEAEFLAMVLVMVYIGAVMVLFLFVVMMLDIDLEKLREGFWRYLPAGALVGGVIVIELGMVLSQDFFRQMPVAEPVVSFAKAHAAPEAAVPVAGKVASTESAKTGKPREGNTRSLGALLSSVYTYPFELAAVVLLVAIVAAVSLTFRGKRRSRNSDPAEQIRVRAKDRLRIVHMSVERDEPTTEPTDAKEQGAC